MEIVDEEDPTLAFQWNVREPEAEEHEVIAGGGTPRKEIGLLVVDLLEVLRLAQPRTVQLDHLGRRVDRRDARTAGDKSLGPQAGSASSSTRAFSGSSA